MTDQWLPDLRTLHERHRGLTEAVCHAYAEAAGICLTYDDPPATIRIDVADREEALLFLLSWNVPGERERSAWANRTDAVEMGAYALALATVEAVHGWFAIARAETLTGADYYVGPPGVDLETAHRLEVSGTDSYDENVLRERLARKVRQARAGLSALAGLACVVGFQIGLILVSDLERPR